MSFIKNVFSTLIGVFLFFVVSFIILIIGIVALSSSDKPLQNNSILHLKFDKSIVEREEQSFLKELINPIKGEEKSIGLLELKNAIQQATNKPEIKGIYLEFGMINSGIANLKDIRDELILFKKSGKKIWAYAPYYTEAAYYLASAADEIYMPSSGIIEFNGLNAELFYFKNLLAKLDIQVDVFKVGKYKSAVEPFVNEKMSDENRLQIRQILESIYGTMLSDISSSRSIDVKELRTISDSLKVRNAETAKKYKLITHVGYYDEMILSMSKQISVKEEEIKFVSYLNDHLQKKLEDIEKTEIAVYIAHGEIVLGKSSEGNIGSETMCADLRKLRKDENVKGVVIRINSPGGSALASDLIWREIVELKKVKPVYASMGNLAASGGYYIAMACDTILAMPTTITGSIGVFGMMVNAKAFLENKIGVTSDREQTGSYSGMVSIAKPLSASEKQIVQEEVNAIYKDFITKVADSRKMSVDKVDELASGRVWTGADALTNHLVDGIGNLNYSIQLLKSKAKIDTTAQVVYYPKNDALGFDQLFESEENERLKTLMHVTKFNEWYNTLYTISTQPKSYSIQAQMPYYLTIE